ncbi:hypothetical protein CHH67_14710 [Paenibacillus campinasensis]|uniref:Uncharacterized protein n=1 Tax=Paenibacillus campinasensis TaxID=66347 RepID=A0A268EQQ3_9BACL|nr:hypothetical protein CHH67_14710 [Paenibacillus campinasensis]
MPIMGREDPPCSMIAGAEVRVNSERAIKGRNECRKKAKRGLDRGWKRLQTRVWRDFDDFSNNL